MTMDQGITDLNRLRALLVATKRRAWVRAVGAPASPGCAHLLFAFVIVGPEPERWRSEEWVYEQCVFASSAITTKELVLILTPGEPKELALGSVRMQVEIGDASFSWLRKPSQAVYDDLQFQWPTTLFTPGLAVQGQVQAPGSFLVGQGDAPSFPVFSGAFQAFFYGNYVVSGTQNPSLGQMSIRIVDERARIQRVRPREADQDVWIGGHALRGTRLEFNSATTRAMLEPTRPGRLSFQIPQGDMPSDAWLWLKQGQNWLDFRSLREWGGRTSPVADVARIEAPVAQSGKLSHAKKDGVAWLRERATTYARRALAAYVSQEYHDFFLFAGLAVELAIKSRLAEENLMFLAPAQNFAATLALWNARGDVVRLPPGTRTIGEWKH